MVMKHVSISSNASCCKVYHHLMLASFESGSGKKTVNSKQYTRMENGRNLGIYIISTVHPE